MPTTVNHGKVCPNQLPELLRFILNVINVAKIISYHCIKPDTPINVGIWNKNP